MNHVDSVAQLIKDALMVVNPDGPMDIVVGYATFTEAEQSQFSLTVDGEYFVISVRRN